MKTKELFKVVAWDIINPFILGLKKKKRYEFPSSITGLNLGCGLDNAENWIGIDGGITNYLMNKYPKIISKPFSGSFNMSTNSSFEDFYSKARKMKLIHHELKYGIPFHDNCVPNIYSSHFFEHLFKADAEHLLKECYRVLKPGGKIRICVPSLESEVLTIEQAIQEYRNGNSHAIQRYVTQQATEYAPAFSNHRWMYNFNEMQKLLDKVGFSKIQQYEPKQGEIPDVTELDIRDGLLVEATKLTHELDEFFNFISEQ
jgi:predicted SAM-dependent methyltransferase